MKILADIGGTHARFAVLEDKIHHPLKLLCSDYASLAEALESYCSELGAENKGQLYLASAAIELEPGHWSFTNFNKWTFSHEELNRSGWQVCLHVNDFMASAYGAFSRGIKSCAAIKDSHPQDGDSFALIGPGSGLGLAYATQIKGQWHIQKSHGGHMLATALTDEQHIILKIVNRIKEGETLIVPEDLISGRGLPNLYRAVCLYSGQSEKHKIVDVGDLLKAMDDLKVKDTLRLFHEFLGLFAHNVVVTGNAYGGLYLDGGVFHKLREHNLWDISIFEPFFVLNPVPIVKQDLQNTPIFAVEDPFVALHGLKEMIYQ